MKLHHQAVQQELENLGASPVEFDSDEPEHSDFDCFEQRMYGLWQDVVTSSGKPSSSPEALLVPDLNEPAEALRSHLQSATPESLRICPAILRILQGDSSSYHRDWFVQRPLQAGTMVLYLAPFWRRPLSEWRAGGDFEENTISLLRHLFEESPVAGCLYTPWREPDCGGYLSWKWTFWLVLMGQGADLSKAGESLGWRMPDGFLEHFSAAPAELTPDQACTWAEVARVGGSLFARRVMRQCYVYRWDSTDLTPNVDHVHARNLDAHRRFWEETVQWLTSNEAELSEAQAVRILRWAILEHTDAMLSPRPFRWANLAPTQALEVAQQPNPHLD